MAIRLATPKDEDSLVEICWKAFFDESLFGETIHPHRHEYPDDVKVFWHNWIRNDFKEPRNRTIVATTIENGQEVITGMATWQRQGDDEYAVKLQEDFKQLDTTFPSLTPAPNRAIDPTRENILQSTEPFSKHFWAPTTNGIPRSRNWYLNLCCVNPSYHGRGVGKHLVAWGLERAREEGVHASVTASHDNDVFYLRCGFDEIVGNCVQGEGNPLVEAGTKGGNILFMWAKGEGKEGDRTP